MFQRCPIFFMKQHWDETTVYLKTLFFRTGIFAKKCTNKGAQDVMFLNTNIIVYLIFILVSKKMIIFYIF